MHVPSCVILEPLGNLSWPLADGSKVRVSCRPYIISASPVQMPWMLQVVPETIGYVLVGI